MIRPIVFTLLIFIGSPLIAQMPPAQVPDSVIAWNAANKLSWADFSGPIDMNVIAAASTSYKIEVLPQEVMVDEQDNIQNVEQLTVQAWFFKNQSWRSTNTLSILHHEQLHFDIAELFARKIRKRFAELKAAGQAKFSVYWDAYQLYWKACRRYQNQYDSQTNHGDKVPINKQWEERIAAELQELDAFRL